MALSVNRNIIGFFLNGRGTGLSNPSIILVVGFLRVIYIIEQLLALAGLVVVTEVFKFLEGHILLEQEAHELIAGNGLIILKANQSRAIE